MFRKLPAASYSSGQKGKESKYKKNGRVVKNQETLTFEILMCSLF